MIRATMGDFMLETVEKYGNKMAMEFKGEYYSWNELHICSEIMANELLKAGVKKGDHVGIWGMNSANWIISYFAITKIGAIAVLLNFNYKFAELADVIRIGNVKWLVYGNTVELLNNPSGIDEVKRLTDNQLQGLFDIRSENKHKKQWMKTYIDTQWETVRSSGDECDDVCCMLFTSGTTSKPKGVMLTHYNMINNAFTVAENTHFSEKDKICLSLPLFHCFGITVSLLAGMHYGTLFHILESFRTVDILKCVDWYQCTVLNGVPTTFLAMINNRHFPEYKTRQLRVSMIGGSPVTPQQMESIQTTFPDTKFMIVYGQTEASPCITMTDYIDSQKHICETIGKPISEVAVQIYKDNSFCGVEEPGEIVARGYNIMKGYFMLEQSRQAVDADGWLHTEDIGYFDKEGYVHIGGRQKDIIIRGGENISPMEVEKAIMDYPMVLDVKVMGVPNAILGEEVAACLLLQKRNKYDEQELWELLGEKLSKYKIPSYIEIFEEFPMNVNGKIDVRKLKEQLLNRLSQ